jgi:hypothetical protein
MALKLHCLWNSKGRKECKGKEMEKEKREREKEKRKVWKYRI